MTRKGKGELTLVSVSISVVCEMQIGPSGWSSLTGWKFVIDRVSVGLGVGQGRESEREAWTADPSPPNFDPRALPPSSPPAFPGSRFILFSVGIPAYRIDVRSLKKVSALFASRREDGRTRAGWASLPNEGR